MGKNKKDESAEAVHWADQIAGQIINKKKKQEYSIGTGVTPSGTLHIGNFRELVTGEFIAKALKDADKKAVHYHYWDDYDVFRKIPSNMPKQDILKKHLRKALIYVPDVVCDKHKNYSEHNEREIEQLLPIVGMHPTILRNSERYMNCEYSPEMKTALEKNDEIKKIFNKYRKEDLADDWLPVTVYCEKCHLEAEKVEYPGGSELSYECSCGNRDTFDFTKKGLAKLKWRVQWPAWWNNKDIDFESAGKDHFASGGSIDTGKEVQKKIYGTEPPFGFGFGWIGVKGGKQFSSSTGVIFTLKDVLDVYEPSIVRYIFAGSRPTSEFDISFDLDVIKIYEDFDKCERIYFKQEEASERDYQKQKRIYELSAVNLPKKMPFQPSFRHLTNAVQVHELDIDKAMGEYKEELKTDYDRERFRVRAQCCINWLSKYADDAFKFKVQDKVPDGLKLDEKQKIAIKKISEILKKKVKDEKELHEKIYAASQEIGIKPGELFKAAYKVLINKERGPRLASFILTLGAGRVVKLFEKV